MIISNYTSNIFMIKKYNKIVISFTVILILSINTSLLGKDRNNIVELEVIPDISEFSIINIEEKRVVSPIDVSITVKKYTPQDVDFEWNLKEDGPGKIEGDRTSSAIFYVPPSDISEESAKAIVTLKVINRSNQEVVCNLSKDFLIKKIWVPIITIENERGRKLSSSLSISYNIHKQEKINISANIFSEKIFQINCTSLKGKVKINKETIRRNFGGKRTAIRNIEYVAPNEKGKDILIIRIIEDNSKIMIAQRTVIFNIEE